MAAAALATPAMTATVPAAAEEPVPTVHVSGTVDTAWCAGDMHWNRRISFGTQPAAVGVGTLIGLDRDGTFVGDGRFHADVPIDVTMVTVSCQDTAVQLMGFRITNSGLALTGDTQLELHLPELVSIGLQVTDNGIPYPGNVLAKEECVGAAQVQLAPGLQPHSGCQTPWFSRTTTDGRATIRALPTPRLSQVIVANTNFAPVAYVYDLEVLDGRDIPVEIGTPQDPVEIEPPAPPSIVDDGASDAAGSRQLTWQPPVDDGGLAVTGYRLSVDGRPGQTPVAGTTAAVTGLTPGVPQTIRVRAANAVGPSTTDTAITFVPGAPDAPDGITARQGDGTLEVNWTAARTAADAPITRYVVHVNDDGTHRLPADRQVNAGPASSTTQLPAGSARALPAVGLQAFTAFGASPVRWTTATIRSTPSPPPPPPPPPAPTPPGAPNGVRVVAGDRSARVAWAPPGTDGGAPITGYLATLTPGGRTCLVAAPALTCTVTALTNGRTYRATVQAVNSAGTSPASTASNDVIPAGPPGPPRSPRAAYIAARRTQVTWLPAIPNGRAVTRYWIRLTANRGLTWTRWSPVGVGRTVTLRGLIRGRTYALQLRASNAIGHSRHAALALRPTR